MKHGDIQAFLKHSTSDSTVEWHMWGIRSTQKPFQPIHLWDAHAFYSHRISERPVERELILQSEQTSSSASQ